MTLAGKSCRRHYGSARTMNQSSQPRGLGIQGGVRLGSGRRGRDANSAPVVDKAEWQCRDLGIPVVGMGGEHIAEGLTTHLHLEDQRAFCSK